MCGGSKRRIKLISKFKSVGYRCERGESRKVEEEAERGEGRKEGEDGAYHLKV